MTPSRYSVLLMASMLNATVALSDGAQFGDSATVSIRYELTTHPANGTEEEMARGYPNLLRVFLQMRNTHDSDLTWVGNSVSDIEAQLIHESGQPAPVTPTFSSILHSDRAMLIPFGSSLDWMISHMGVSMIGDRANDVAIIVGGRGWLIPKASLHRYSLTIRVRGLPWARFADARGKRERVLLFDIPSTPISIE